MQSIVDQKEVERRFAAALRLWVTAISAHLPELALHHRRDIAATLAARDIAAPLRLIETAETGGAEAVSAQTFAAVAFASERDPLLFEPAPTREEFARLLARDLKARGGMTNAEDIRSWAARADENERRRMAYEIRKRAEA